MLSPQKDSEQKKIENIFTYTMYIIRAIKNKPDRIGLRKCYTEEHKEYLEDPKKDLMGMIENQANLWSEIHKDFSKSSAQNHYPNIVPEGDEDSKKYIQLLNGYVNDYWKWVVSTLWHHQKSNGSGIQKLKTSDLRKLVAFLYFFISQVPKKGTRPQVQTFFGSIEILLSGKTLFESDVFKSDEKITKEEDEKITKEEEIKQSRQTID